MGQSLALHDWCPICEKPTRSEGALAKHMKDFHKRLIRYRDIAKQEEAINIRNRLANLMYEEAV